MQRISIIIPVLNEQNEIHDALMCLQKYRRQGHEIIVVDGRSEDNTVKVAGHLCDKLISSAAGRARQMNAGAEQASGDILLFLHIDTRLPGEAVEYIRSNLHKYKNKVWGRFDVKLSGKHPLLSIVALLMNLRSRITGIATGDQAIFTTKQAFLDVNAYPEIPLMEDIRFSRKLLGISRPICIKNKLTTSSRRWEENGIIRTILLMWYLRLAHFCGKHPDELSRLYSKQ